MQRINRLGQVRTQPCHGGLVAQHDPHRPCHAPRVRQRNRLARRVVPAPETGHGATAHQLGEVTPANPGRKYLVAMHHLAWSEHRRTVTSRDPVLGHGGQAVDSPATDRISGCRSK